MRIDALEQPGIGTLTSLQYEDAIQAFEQVVRLRPEYKDG